MTHMVVLTAAAGVSDAVAEDVARALGGTPNRLAETAVEVAVDGPVDAAAPEGVDLNVVPVAGREKRMLIADMDSTMIPVECIDELADFAGVKDRVADITERAMRGELDFEAALRERVGLVKGLPTAALEQCYAERIALNPGAEVLVRTMAARGAQTALVSGGFTFFTSRVAAAAGFAVNRANTLLFEDDRLTGDVTEPILGRQAKLDALHELAGQGGFGPDAVIAVGDGANDLAMVEAAGLGVAYKAKPALKNGADAVLDHSDLTALLALQGIPQAEWWRG
ncbi:phosphoserine phosphatase SerB [Pontivivens ytuae]|uniref:Phosphoserine phosphatase n=1 Tax=Pontivivens ytuae TaxID=2789856 RepID=A0A7S9LQX9_9RHOB|nr:phosphoserine phosphatase SerB [Pontivivens ytuae]QPH53365.1 phosphoserine phosphatase SerB [Pontivivens ytuae]